jgi:hypothetical protein
MRPWFLFPRLLPFLLLAAAIPPALAGEYVAIPRVLPAPATALPEPSVSDPLRKEVDSVKGRVEALRLKEPERTADVEVFFKAADFALEIGEFWNPKDIDKVRTILDEGNKRLAALEKGDAYWTRQRGAVVRGFYSRIDGYPQPYGLEIPEGLTLPDPTSVKASDTVPPLWIWLHGRGDKETDLHFIAGRMTRKGQFQPADAIIVHPLGRQCIGWKGPGETDALECADAAARALYGPEGHPRFAMMGFSMGGGGSWQLGAHYPWKWSVVHAGAGFVDVARFTKMPKEEYPSPIVETLWGVYNVPGYVHNLFNMPVLAYSGEIDKQRDAAEFMSEVFQSEGQTLRHIIGPEMPHKYDPASIEKVTRFVQSALRGEESSANAPGHFSLQTRTLRYHRAPFIRANGLERHWEDSRVDLECESAFSESNSFHIKTRNLTDLTIGEPGLTVKKGAKISVDGVELINPNTEDGFRLTKSTGKWAFAVDDLFAPAAGLKKTPGRQGPVDDAFMEPFLVVLPEGPCRNAAVEQWVSFELEHFLRRWREVFRGKARVKKASEVTAADMREYHLICWGDAGSNSVIAKALPKLPLKWTESTLTIGSHSVNAKTHVPILIYLNPLDSAKPGEAPHYLVLNSGPTFREKDDRNNSQQNPKLPDWTLVDVTIAPDDTSPGGIVAADFFDEFWQVK